VVNGSRKPTVWVAIRNVKYSPVLWCAHRGTAIQGGGANPALGLPGGSGFCRHSDNGLWHLKTNFTGRNVQRGVLRKNLMVLSFRLIFMPPFFPVDIRDADRPGQSSLPLVAHTEFGDLKFPAPECLLVGQVCLAPGECIL